ncbi:60S ribosome subunit biogenesis protein NIP7 like protein [Ditylenchus destructor]|nr:60S ribosome subunit biogenesis protein NIP7 like protein [Ditylenchus destructor]
MRPLTDEETQKLFTKLAKYIGDNVRLLLEREDGTYCFRFHRERIYYSNEKLMKQAATISRKELLSFGTCLGKFTKSGSFYLHITALDYLAPYAKWRVWLKPNAEQQFLYGNNIVKSGVGRMTDGIEAKSGVVVYNMADMPLGFGVASKGTTECRRADPTMLVVLHQGDLGEYIRHEDTLT